jgi:hypothetical protein
MFRQDLQTSPAMRPLSAPIGHLSKNIDDRFNSVLLDVVKSPYNRVIEKWKRWVEGGIAVKDICRDHGSICAILQVEVLVQPGLKPRTCDGCANLRMKTTSLNSLSMSELANKNRPRFLDKA